MIGDSKEIEEKRALLKAKKIGVLMGGFSKERDISLKSGKAVVKALTSMDYKAVSIDVERDLPLILAKDKIDVAFIALHGRCGEDGSVQGLLELMGIPYTGSGVLASAVAMDKAMAKRLFMACSIPTPPFEVVGADGRHKTNFEGPLIVKPAREGSTLGIGLVESQSELKAAIDKALEYDVKVIVERFVEGRELTVSILDDKVFPVVEIITTEPIYQLQGQVRKGDKRVQGACDTQ